MPRLVAVLASAVVLASCAPAGTGAPGVQAATGDHTLRQCFQPQRVINFRQGEAQQVNLRVLGGDVYQISSAGCQDLGSTNGLTITPATGVGDRLCVGDTARITVLNPTFPQGACLARIDRVLTRAEVEALPSRQRP